MRVDHDNHGHVVLNLAHAHTCLLALMQLIVLMDPHDDIDDILRANRSREKHYVFDHIFSSEASQEDVYCSVVQEKNIIERVLSGYNCTVFAYGATGR